MSQCPEILMTRPMQKSAATHPAAMKTAMRNGRETIAPYTTATNARNCMPHSVSGKQVSP